MLFTEEMDQRLIDVAEAGDIEGLYTLLNEDRTILDKVDEIGFINTPLHISVINGHTPFASEIANLKPKFARKLNEDGFSPLHIAAAIGKLKIVRDLLKVDKNLCLLKGREKMIPLHCAAAISGNEDVLEELLSARPKSIKELTVGMETALHLAVKNDRYYALKELLKWLDDIPVRRMMLKWVDDGGNTILHFAASRRKLEMVKLVCRYSTTNNGILAVPINAINTEGFTALDILLYHTIDVPDEEEMQMLQILRNSGAKIGQQVITFLPPPGEAIKRFRSRRITRRIASKLEFLFPVLRRDVPSDVRNALLVVVVLIVTATYQLGINPPGGLWQDNYDPSSSNDINSNPSSRVSRLEQLAHEAGTPVLATQNPGTFLTIMLLNYAALCLSVVITFSLTEGYPLRASVLIALCLILATYGVTTSLYSSSLYAVLFPVLFLTLFAMGIMYLRSRAMELLKWEQT
ncbi:ankyrin repeat-containing protein BDA1-like isoform X1 [Macadamia integrifolia]|uniref:ankyrin repeat-containing protein BDA1-like isoform X1 n=1 Tax=Macadamia integrifolia TaxID=60698 RepID=UPI001C4E3512|nr:ankyrin repeat-containing protein BDA1-like isoform X1 [Macadamia integrifolia]